MYIEISRNELINDDNNILLLYNELNNNNNICLICNQLKTVKDYKFASKIVKWADWSGEYFYYSHYGQSTIKKSIPELKFIIEKIFNLNIDEKFFIVDKLTYWEKCEQYDQEEIAKHNEQLKELFN